MTSIDLLTILLTGTPQHKGPALPAPCISTSDTMDAPSIILSTFLPPEGAEADTEKDHNAVARQGIGKFVRHCHHTRATKGLCAQRNDTYDEDYSRAKLL